ncbi:hypothetical protein GCM10009102_29290 [Sphingomonas insulae]|uniref:Uncharacterized protein n=1 Tax=Sphingomonas insulae TaxID=424800 RepID=A0ABN1HZL3_9SPHN
MEAVAARFGPAMPQAPVETICPLRIRAIDALSTRCSRRVVVISGSVKFVLAFATEAEAISMPKPP